jgi:methylated-DNA-[protein]-cysteine S-methyltransferase
MVLRWTSSPLGRILLRAENDWITGLYFENQKYFPVGLDFSKSSEPSDCLDLAETQLREYFVGERVEFQLPCSLAGTDFQRNVWNRLLLIPIGELTTYGDLANELDCPDASRAVGAAVGRNPISLIYPCHRVVAKSGSLTGYAGGLDRKRWLLDWEKASSRLHQVN